MYSRTHRLAAERDIVEVVRKGRQFAAGELAVRVVYRQVAGWRVAVTVGTKISKRAVVRNRLRRRIREVLRKMMPVMTGGGDMVVVTRPGADKLEYEGVRARLVHALSGAGIYKEVVEKK
jgi:ribonuclease P protein component